MKYDNRYTVGIDIGNTSVGYSIVDQEEDNLIEFGVRHFEEAKEASERRKFRSARRTQRRKVWRKKQLKQAFVDFGLISENEINTKNYTLYYAKNDELIPPKDYTVYHLRKRALEEQISKREILLCLYNISQARGHFLWTQINFDDKGSISIEMLKNNFYELCQNYIEFINDLNEFENKVLFPLFNNEVGINQIKLNYKNLNKDIVLSGNEKLLSILTLLQGGKVKLTCFGENISIIEGEIREKPINVSELKTKDNLNNFLEKVVNLYDMIKIFNILKDKNYICEVNIEKIKNYDISDDKKGKSIKNYENTWPNGLYVKEVKDLLKNQQKYYGKDEIPNEFIEVCCSIISAKIPYYIGPLDEKATNAWLFKKNNFKYSYDYSKNNVDKYKTIKKWKNRMISNCTYLPTNKAMPKGSFVGETFSIVNEINLYKAEDKYGNDYELTYEDKVKIFNKLFLRQKSVSLNDVAELLELNSYHSRNGNVKVFNNKYSIYFDISRIENKYIINDIEEIFTNDNKIKELENLILDLNLFDDQESKYEYFKDDISNYNFDDDIAKKLSKLNCTGYYSLSKEFVMDFKIDGINSLMYQLFNTNHEQMYLISHATDKNGEIIDLASNKYIKIIENNPNLSIDLLINEEQPILPISRIVVRALNECLKVYSQIIEYYGVPKKLVIETARDFNDSDKKGKKPKTHREKMNDLLTQLKGNKLIDEDWENIESYLNKNKEKIELYIRQLGKDMITGKPILLNELDKYEIDHILPAGFGDDSIDNKELIIKEINSIKNNRLPLEFIIQGADEIAKLGYNITTNNYIQRVKELYGVKVGKDGEDTLISSKKYKMLLMENQSDIEGFIEQSIVDTRYVIREFTSIINAMNKVNNYDTHVVSLKATYNDLYKKALGIRKNRDLGLQHHAIDATMAIVSDACINAYYPNYDQRKNSYDSYNFFKEAISKILKNDNTDNSFEKLKKVAKGGFEKAFGISTKHSKLLEKMYHTTPLYSEKALKNWRGQYFDSTLYSPNKKKDVLSVIGINNEKRSFNSIKCVAVDFYKITKIKRGVKTREHVAIHIPKVIVDMKGSINKEQYKKLIIDYYKIPELLNDDGEINEKFYRFRAFKGDIIYDTHCYEPQIFNLGSIANKKLEFKQLNINSYNNIYFDTEKIVNDFSNKFYLNKKYNDVTIKFDDVDKIEIIKYWIDNNLCDYEKAKFEETIINDSELKNSKNLFSFSLRLSYLNTIMHKILIPPTILGRYTPVANKEQIKDDFDAEYVKIKYNILGIRFNNNENNKLLISGPNGHKEAYNKIKKEKFSWKISKYSI